MLGNMVKIKRISKKNAIIVLAVLIFVGAGCVIWQKHTADRRAAAGETDASIQAEKKTTEAFNKRLQDKKQSSNSATGSSDNSSSLKIANVILVAATSNEVRGYVSNVLEEGGTCTATYTKGSTKVTGTSTGTVDVSKTTCTPIPISQLSTGEWTVTLGYSSSTAHGTSESKTISVP